jgi:hypothetical protein
MHLHGHCESPNLSPTDNAKEEAFFLPRRGERGCKNPLHLSSKANGEGAASDTWRRAWRRSTDGR